MNNERLIEIYINSFALVITYFGPTNLPPIEAFKLGVQFLSDFKEMREQMGDAAIFIDIYNPKSLAKN